MTSSQANPPTPASYWTLILAASAVLMVTVGVRLSLGLYVSPINTATGIGITGMTNSTKPPGCHVLPDSVGLPPLGQLEVRLHRAPGKPSVALSRLEDYIAGSFASAGPARITSSAAD